MIGTVASLARFPLKSMLGEQPEAVDVTADGIAGDRCFALSDKASGRIISAKHPRRYPNLLACRATFVDSLGDGFVEDGWVGREIALGDDARFAIALPAPRCVMTTLAVEDLPRDVGVLQTIATHNRVEIVGAGMYPCAGVYAVATAPGTIRVGDTVNLVQAPTHAP